MFPYITVFGRVFTLYMIMSLIGIFVAGIFMCRLTKKRGLDDNDTIVLLLFSAIGVLLGGHILYGITNIKYIPYIFSAESFKEFVSAVTLVFGGSVFYGGLLGGLLAGAITIKLKKHEFAVFSDMAAVVIPLFHAFARVGCFLSGCCYGIESKFGFTVHNNTLVEEINGVSRFPVQLLEATLNILLFLLLWYMYNRSLTANALKGKIMPIYLLLYSVIRFFDEFLRGDEIRGFLFGLSTSQIISIILFAVSVNILVISLIKQPKQKKV